LKIAEAEDADIVFEMSMKFIRDTGYDSISTEEDIKSLIAEVLASPRNQSIIVMDDFGFIAGRATKFPFGPDLIASEIAWWIDPEARGESKGSKLMDAFEYWAKNVAGCKFISMTSLNNTVEKIYRKKGYKLYERAYMKVL